MKKHIYIFTILLLTIPSLSHGYIHVARDGETLNQLASFFYGSSNKSIIIRAANGFMHPDDGSVLQGERIEIPGIQFHKVSENEDWYSLANKYLGSSKRASFLAELNNKSVEGSLAEGQIVKIPYQLLYIFAPDESIKTVTRMFLGKKFKPNWLRKYNLKKKKKFGRGDAILIPLINLEYTNAAKKEIKANQPKNISKKDKEAQVLAISQISNLRESYIKGKYLNIVIIGQKLLSNKGLTNPQKIGVYKYLAFAYIAFDEKGLAKLMFEKALKLQPSMELSPITVSPKILELFQEVQQRLVPQK